MRLRLILSVLFRVRIWTGQGCQKCRVFRESMENPVLFCCFRREYPPNRAASHWKGGCRWVRRRGSENTKRWGKSHGIGFGFVHAHKKHDEIVRFL